MRVYEAGESRENKRNPPLVPGLVQGWMRERGYSIDTMHQAIHDECFRDPDLSWPVSHRVVTRLVYQDFADYRAVCQVARVLGVRPAVLYGRLPIPEGMSYPIETTSDDIRRAMTPRPGQSLTSMQVPQEYRGGDLDETAT